MSDDSGLAERHRGPAMVSVSAAASTVSLALALMCLFSYGVWYFTDFVLINPALSIVTLLGCCSLFVVARAEMASQNKRFRS